MASKAKPRLFDAPPADEPGGPIDLGDRPASEIRTERLSWLWEYRLQHGTVAIIQGGKGCGKSTWLRALAAAVTGGPAVPPGGRRRVTGNVLWYAGEESAEKTIRPGLAAAGADLARVFIGEQFSDDPALELRLPADADRLEKRILVRSASLVVLDPLFSFVDASCDLEGPTMPARRYMRAVAAVAKRTGAVILLSRNLTKDKSRGAIASGRGSAEIGNQARSILHIDQVPSNPGVYGLAVAACNDGRKVSTILYRIEEEGGSAVIRPCGDSEIDADQLAAGDEGLIEAKAIDRAKALVRHMIPTGKVNSDTLRKRAEEALISVRTLQKALNLLGCVNIREGSREDTVSFWSPPPGGWKAPTASARAQQAPRARRKKQ